MRKYVIAIILPMLLSACSGSGSVDGTLSQCEASIADGNFSDARVQLDDILNSGNAKNLSARQLGELSIMYMQISESDDQEDNTAIAYQCYRNAYKVNADSAAAFYGAVSGENARYVQMLQTLVQMMENPDKYNFDDHEEHVTESDTPTSQATE